MAGPLSAHAGLLLGHHRRPRRDDPPDRPRYRAQNLHAVNASGGVLQAIIVFLSCRQSFDAIFIDTGGSGSVPAVTRARRCKRSVWNRWGRAAPPPPATEFVFDKRLCLFKEGIREGYRVTVRCADRRARCRGLKLRRLMDKANDDTRQKNQQRITLTDVSPPSLDGTL